MFKKLLWVLIIPILYSSVFSWDKKNPYIDPSIVSTTVSDISTIKTNITAIEKSTAGVVIQDGKGISTSNGSVTVDSFTSRGNITAVNYYGNGFNLTGLSVSTAPVIPTIMIAAFDSSQSMKNESNFVCTGSSDEITIMQALFSIQGGKINFAEGTYIPNNPIFMANLSSITISGIGNGAKIVLADNANYWNNPNQAGIFHSTGSIYNVTFENLIIDGNKNNNIDDGVSELFWGIFLGSSTIGVTIRDCTFQNIANAGININGVSDDIKIYHNTFKNIVNNNDNGGIAIRNNEASNAISIYDNYYESLWKAVYFQICKNLTLNKNTLTDCEYGFGINTASSGTITNNIMNNLTSGSGIDLELGINYTISINNITGSAGSGITFRKSRILNITGNTIVKSAYGIYATTQNNVINQDCIISDNICLGNGDGINLINLANSALTGNICNSNTGNGLSMVEASPDKNYSNTFTGNIFNNNITGIYVINTSSNMFTGNKAYNNSVANADFAGCLALKQNVNSWQADALMIDGSNSMTGTLDMGNFGIINCPSFVSTATYSVAGSSIADIYEKTYSTAKATGTLAGVDTTIAASTLPVTTMAYQQSSGRTSRIAVISNGDGTVNVSSGTGFSRTSDSELASLIHFDWSQNASLSLTDNALNYVYVDYNGGSPTISATTSILKVQNKFPIAIAHRYGNDVEIAFAGEYLPNSFLSDWKRLAQRGIEKMSGATISSSGTLALQSTAGIFYYAGNEIDTLPTNSITTPIQLFRTTASSWTWTNIQNFSADNTGYDSGTGTITPFGGGAGHYGIFDIYVCLQGEIYAVYGRGDYTSIANAQASLVVTPPSYLQSFAKLAARVVVQKSGTSFSAITNVVSAYIPNTAVGIHNDLGGLQGGGAGDYQHLTTAQLADVFNVVVETVTIQIKGSSTTTIGELDSFVDFSTYTLVRGRLKIRNASPDGDIIVRAYRTSDNASMFNQNFTIPTNQKFSNITTSSMTLSGDDTLVFEIIQSSSIQHGTGSAPCLINGYIEAARKRKPQ